MKRALPLLAAAAASVAQPVLAQADAPLGILPVGRYECSLPGDAGGPAWHAVPEMKFSIRSASRYAGVDGDGTYLLRGDELVFSRGPMKDHRFKRTGNFVLRQIEADGSIGRLRCIRSGPLE